MQFKSTKIKILGTENKLEPNKTRNEIVKTNKYIVPIKLLSNIVRILKDLCKIGKTLTKTVNLNKIKQSQNSSTKYINYNF